MSNNEFRILKGKDGEAIRKQSAFHLKFDIVKIKMNKPTPMNFRVRRTGKLD
jgi:hypothetical protein